MPYYFEDLPPVEKAEKKVERRERKRKPKMLVSGRGVFTLQEIIKKRAEASKENKKRK